MKRDRDRGKSLAPQPPPPPPPPQQQKPNPWSDQADTGMDELFAVLGYKVKSSDMADVAEKLEQLEMAMGNTTTTQEGGGVSVLSTDTVHYNPSDLSGWVDNMLTELDIFSDNSTSISTNINNLMVSSQVDNNNNNYIYDDDLRAIPGGAVFNANNKRIKSSTDHSIATTSDNLTVLVDSQEAGVRLVHTLMACADAVQNNNLKLADALIKHVGLLAVSQVGAMRKVATYFAEALARKIYKIYPQDALQTSYSDVLQMHFYETAPYLKFAHFTANQAILEAFSGASRVHVIDFSLKQGMQWPALLQALALRPGGPPAFRLTGIGPPQPDKSDALQEVGLKLAQLADSIGVEFEFRGFVTNSLADLDAKMLDIKPDGVETVVVNSVFELHRMLARPGAIEKVLGSIKAMNPKIVTVVEQEGSHNGEVFIDRFNEALHYYSTMFDSLEGSGSSVNGQDLVMTEVYLGRQICNVVACEGADRVERHEKLGQWRVRMDTAGFSSVHLGSNAFKQASMLLALFGGDGYRVEENEGCLMLGWHTRPLIATSAWRIAS